MRHSVLAAGVVALSCSGCDSVFSIDHVSGDGAVAVRDDGAIHGDAGPYPVDGLVASYTFDDSDRYRDVTGHGNDAYCVTCPSIVPGKRGSAISFDGSQRLAAPSLVLPQITVAFWFDAVPVLRDECPINKLYGSLNYNSWQMCLGAASPNTFVELYAYPSTSIVTSNSLTSGWHHAAFSYDGTRSSLAIDGITVGTTPMGAILYDDGSITIGMDLDGGQPTAPFVGSLDEIKFFDRALSESEIATVANTP